MSRHEAPHSAAAPPGRDDGQVIAELTPRGRGNFLALACYGRGASSAEGALDSGGRDLAAPQAGTVVYNRLIVSSPIENPYALSGRGGANHTPLYPAIRSPRVSRDVAPANTGEHPTVMGRR